MMYNVILEINQMEIYVQTQQFIIMTTFIGQPTPAANCDFVVGNGRWDNAHKDSKASFETGAKM